MSETSKLHPGPPVLPGLFALLLLAASPGHADSWHDAPPFSLDAADLRAAVAAAAPAEGVEDPPPVTVYLQDTAYRFDAEGRLTQERHWIYGVHTAEALADWGTSQVRWSKWLHERPSIEARVITADGEEYRLRDGVAKDRRLPEGGGGLYGDRWLTEAPLPAVSVGAVIEERIVLRELTPAFDAGTSHRHYMALLAPTAFGRLTLEASKRLALRFGTRLLPGVEPQTTVEDDSVRVVFEVQDLSPVMPPEEGAPGHRPRFPQVAFSTGRSWQRVAAGFAARIDQAVAAARLDALGADLRAAASLRPRERVQSILETVRGKLRWNGLAIGATPLDLDLEATLARGTGDSLALAATTVAALRRAGIRAHVALVRGGFGVDVEPRLPGLGLFDHALVWLEDAGGESPWIEPAATYARAGELTLVMQGRYALIVKGDSEELVITPASEPAENLAMEVREVRFADYGPGRLLESCTYHGSAERTQRRITGSLDASARRRGYQAYANAFHLASELGELRETEPADLSKPFELYLEAIDSGRVRTELDHAVLEVPVRELARRLPPVLLDDPRPRREEFIFPEPFVSRWQYLVSPPEGFRLEGLPESRRIRLGPAVFEERWRLEGELVIGDLSFDVGQRLLAPRQFEALRSAVSGFLERPATLLRYRLRAAEALGAGELPEALANLRTAADAEPGRASHRVRWALGLLRAGLGVEARRQAQQAIALAPRWGLAHWAFGWVLLHDEVGTFFAPGSELEEARKALEEARRLSPDEPLVSAAQARLFERGPGGVLYEGGADLERAAAAYRHASLDSRDPVLHLDRMRLLVLLERWEELREAAAIAGDRLVADPLAGMAADDWAAAAPSWLSSTNDLDSVFGALANHRLDGESALGLETPNRRRAVALELARGRHYAVAAELAQGADDTLAARLAAVRRYEDVELHPQDPATPIRALLAALRRRPLEPEDTARWLASSVGSKDSDAMVKRLEKILPTDLEGLHLPPATRADLAVADLAPKVNGAPHLGYRLSLGDQRFFVTLEGEELQLAAEGKRPETLGAEALRRVEAGDLPGGQKWLAWAAEEIRGSDVEVFEGDPLGFSAFLRLWPAELPEDEELLPADTLRLAAAALAAPVDPGGEALTILQRAEEGRAESAADRPAIEAALLDAYSSVGDYLGLESHAGLMVEKYPSSHRAFVRQLEALAALERWQDVEKAARSRSETQVADPDARRVLAGLAVDRGTPESAADQLRAIARDSELTVNDAANLLLLMLRGGEPSRSEAEALLDRTEEEGQEDGRWWRAAAAWYAHGGEVKAAREALAASVRFFGGRLQLADAYVVGRLAEHCGLPETAQDLYRRLARDSDSKRRAPLMRLLAEDRLRHLQDLRSSN